ncbi:hypothetical protein BDN72DRAFT_902162 [Pluteus cervinus]|uniref:Uncharacterized protein n=1 Tax=Pluteus cervinus TaxID=181527 RepID=A0ACD3AFW7_9AGAR|nr:hypothetical protein BDN72DRAFT_902162 [Pluteus cervinus]
MQPSSPSQSSGASGSKASSPKGSQSSSKTKKTLLKKAKAKAVDQQVSHGLTKPLGVEERVQAALSNVSSVQMIFRNYELGSRKTTVWRRITDGEVAAAYIDAQDKAIESIEKGTRVVKPQKRKREKDSEEKRTTKKQATASPSSPDTPTAADSPKDDEIKLTIQTEHCIGKHIVATVNFNGKTANADNLGLVVTLVNQGGWNAVVQLLQQYRCYNKLENAHVRGLKEMFGVFQLESEYDSPFVAIIHEDFGWPISIQKGASFSSAQKNRLRSLLGEIHKKRYLVGTLSENNLWKGPGNDAYLWGLEDVTKVQGPEDQERFQDEVDALDYLLSPEASD